MNSEMASCRDDLFFSSSCHPIIILDIHCIINRTGEKINKLLSVLLFEENADLYNKRGKLINFQTIMSLLSRNNNQLKDGAYYCYCA